MYVGAIGKELESDAAPEPTESLSKLYQLADLSKCFCDNNLILFSKSSNAKIFVINYYYVEPIVVNPNAMIRMNRVRRVPSQLMLSVTADEVRKLSLAQTKTKFIRVEPSVASF